MNKTIYNLIKKNKTNITDLNISVTLECTSGDKNSKHIKEKSLKADYSPKYEQAYLTTR